MGTALVGQTVLYRWPADGWVRGTVTARSMAAGFSHVVRYGCASALGPAVVPSLLDAATHCQAGRWVLLSLPRCALVWLPFSRTTVQVMGLPGSQSAGCQLQMGDD
jgi:hypothetical protein